MIVVRPVAVVVALLAVPPFLLAADPDKDAKEPAEVSYYRDIRPIFQQHCQGCHQPAKALGSYVMTNHADLLKKGESEQPGIVPGKPAESKVVSQITAQDGKPPAMPKGRPPLPDRDAELIQKWIAQGAKDDTPAAALQVVDADHPPVYTLPPVITALAYSPDSKLLAVSGYHEVLVHKADGSGVVARLVGLSERVQSLAFSPDGTLLAVAGGSPCRFGEIQIWEIAHKKLKLSLSVTFDTVYGASWSPDGTTIAFGCADNTVRAIEAATGKQVLYQGAHSDWVLDTVFSTDGAHVASVSRDRSMKLTEVPTQRFVDNISSITPGALKGGLITVDRRPLFYRKMVKYAQDPVEKLYDELLIGGSDGVPRLYKMHRETKRVIGDDANKIREFDAMPGRIFSARFNRDGSMFVAGSSLDGTGEARVYRVSAAKPDDALLVFSALPIGQDRSLLPFIVPDARTLGGGFIKLEGQKGAVYAVAFRPDGNQVASAGFDGLVRLHDPYTGKLVKELVPVPVNGVLQSNAAGQ